MKTYVISDTGVKLHPQAKNHAKTALCVLQDKVGAQDWAIMWHDVINNTIAKHPHNTRTPLIPVQLLNEIRALQKITGIVYCNREGAANILHEHKRLSMPMVEVKRNLFSRKKQQTREFVAT